MNVEFHHRAGKTAFVSAEVHALDEVEIELPAEVQITVVAIDEADEIEIDRSRAGKVIYRIRHAPRAEL